MLSYAGCGTCKKALRWLAERGVDVDVRPIVDAPPSADELAAWIPKSGRPVQRWLNTSGQSYRALGKAKVDAAKDEEIVRWLTQDGKLVKRPVVVAPTRVLTGAEFDELVKKEDSRAERAQAVVSRAADARAQLLVKDRYEDLAGKAPMRARIEQAAPVIEAVMEEEAMATADDLAALRVP